ncbi:MAG: ASCH domain-containing protein [Polyangiaceae bacterium]|nr:ASCH domain-containing protein [Polyangiaceae bacterium]
MVVHEAARRARAGRWLVRLRGLSGVPVLGPRALPRPRRRASHLRDPLRHGRASPRTPEPVAAATPAAPTPRTPRAPSQRPRALPAADIERAISIRQPYAELILRGVKRNEYRSRATTIRGRVWIHAGLQPADDPAAWRKVGASPGDLPTGAIVGSVEITDCRATRDGGFAYVLAEPQRSDPPRTAKNQPQPVFWRPRF